jgi:hypothetical protein
MSTPEEESPSSSRPNQEPRVLRLIFGDIVISPPHGSSPMLVIGASEDGLYIDGIRIIENSDGIQLGLPGTIRVEDIIDVVGHKDRIEAARLIANKMATTGSPYEQVLQEILDQNPEEN